MLDATFEKEDDRENLGFEKVLVAAMLLTGFALKPAEGVLVVDEAAAAVAAAADLGLTTTNF